MKKSNFLRALKSFTLCLSFIIFGSISDGTASYYLELDMTESPFTQIGSSESAYYNFGCSISCSASDSGVGSGETSIRPGETGGQSQDTISIGFTGGESLIFQEKNLVGYLKPDKCYQGIFNSTNPCNSSNVGSNVNLGNNDVSWYGCTQKYGTGGMPIGAANYIPNSSPLDRIVGTCRETSVSNPGEACFSFGGTTTYPSSDNIRYECLECSNNKYSVVSGKESVSNRNYCDTYASNVITDNCSLPQPSKADEPCLSCPTNSTFNKMAEVGGDQCVCNIGYTAIPSDVNNKVGYDGSCSLTCIPYGTYTMNSETCRNSCGTSVACSYCNGYSGTQGSCTVACSDSGKGGENQLVKCDGSCSSSMSISNGHCCSSGTAWDSSSSSCTKTCSPNGNYSIDIDGYCKDSCGDKLKITSESQFENTYSNGNICCSGNQIFQWTDEYVIDEGVEQALGDYRIVSLKGVCVDNGSWTLSPKELSCYGSKCGTESLGTSIQGPYFKDTSTQ